MFNFKNLNYFIHMYDLIYIQFFDILDYKKLTRGECYGNIVQKYKHTRQ